MIKKIKKYFYSLIYGIGSADEIIFKNNSNDSNTVSINQVMEKESVAKDLLKGEVTQQVQELRYRTYLIDRKAKKYEYFSPTLAKERDKFDTKFINYDKSDNLNIITLQYNRVDTESVYEGLKQVGKRGNKAKHTIRISRNFFPRYFIEDYAKLIVVKELDETHHILDIYFSKYPNTEDFKSKGFVKEIEKIRDKKIKSDILDFDYLKFITLHAYKKEDMLLYEYDNIYFKEVIEYDGHYILKFKAHIINNGIDLTEQFYSSTMAEKYENNVKKDLTININGGHEEKEYICADCGSVIKYDTKLIDEMNYKDGRDIDEEQNEKSNVTEYYDIQIIEQTFGKPLCNKCLKKYIL